MKADEYEIMYQVEDRHWWYRGLRRIIAQHWPAPPPSGRLRVLDAGCGAGANLAAFSPRAQAVGIDASGVAIRFCRRRGLARTAVASVLHLPFPEACFDVVLSCDVLCHKAVADRSSALREMARVLRPGGVLLVNLPAYQGLLSSHDLAVHNDRRFTCAEALALLRAQGLTPLRATYWNTFLFPLIAPLRLWRRLRPRPSSDLDAPPSPRMDAFLSAVLTLERACLRLTPLPFGLSVFIAAQKK